MIKNFCDNNLEEPLPAGGSCLLGSINLAEFVDGTEFDYFEFHSAIRTSVRALNNLLDEGLQLHPLEEQRDSVRKWRQIGLGVFGLADMLIKMGIKYGDSDSIRTCEFIAEDMINIALCESSAIASESKPYPMFNFEEVSNTRFFIENLWEDTQELIKENGLANSQILTIAPTGTLSTMLGVSGGMEPIYATHYERTTESLHDEVVKYNVYTPIVQKYMDSNSITNVEDLPDYFVTAQNLDFKSRIQMQAIWQEFIDASISSTVNVPNSFTVEEVRNLYIYAHELGLKGVTIFRNGCKRTGILNTESTEEIDEKVEPDYSPQWGDVLEVNDNVIGKKRKLMTGCGSLHCTAFFDPITGDLVETYLSKGSSGGCNNFMVGLSRMISLSARAGVHIDTIIDQLNSTGTCPSYSVRQAVHRDASKGSCCPMAIGYALKEMYNEMKDELEDYEYEQIDVTCWGEEPRFISGLKKPKVDKTQVVPCPSCGESLRFEGGCNSCPSCGWSKCS